MRCLLLMVTMMLTADIAYADEPQRLREELGTLQERMKQISKERDAARAQASQLATQRDELLTRVVELAATINRIQSELSESEEARQRALMKIARSKAEAGGDQSMGTAFIRKVTSGRSIAELVEKRIRKGDRVCWPGREAGIDDGLRPGTSENLRKQQQQQRKEKKALTPDSLGPDT